MHSFGIIGAENRRNVMERALIDKIASICEIKENYKLSKISSFKIGGEADIVALPGSINQMSELVKFAESRKIRYRLIGNASNVLFSDEGFKGIIIKTSKMNKIYFRSNEILVEAGVPVTKLAMEVCKFSLSGLEFAYGIPGSLGGAVYMNAGAFGGEFSSVINYVNVLIPGKGIVTIEKKKCDFAYRDSWFQHNNCIILSASISLSKGNKAEIENKMNNYMFERMEKQPLEKPSAGSAFKRPKTGYAGKYIEDAGLKGLTVGGAKVSEKHAGFIINDNSATSKDVMELSEKVIEIVKEKFDVELKREFEFIE